MKGGFQNDVGGEVLDCIAGVEGMGGLCKWVSRFVAGRTFVVSWDGKVRGIGWSSKGVPQGSPFSPVLFLLWMAPILREMERRVVEEVPGVGVEFSSYVDDLHCGLYIGRRRVGNLDTIERREQMGDLLGRVSRTLLEVAGEWGLPLAADKEERLILRNKAVSGARAALSGRLLVHLY